MEGIHSDEEDDAEVGEERDRVLEKVHPFLDLANAAYQDTSMAQAFPDLVTKSQLIRDVKKPSRLLKGLVATDTEVHVCILREGSVAFVFRGTEPDLRDLVTDLARQQKPVKFYYASDIPCYTAPRSIKAHTGFQLAFRDVTKTSNPEENLRMVAEALAGNEGRHVKRVFCVGHSLGGALATLCASWCRYVAFPSAVINCITLGSPRVGNRAFAMDFNKNVAPRYHSYRVVNKGDIVPNVPWIGYKHVSGLVHFEEDPTKKDMILFKHGGRRFSSREMKLEHHFCNAYVVSVSKALLIYKIKEKLHLMKDQ